MVPKFLSVTMAVIAILAALIAAGLGGGYLWLITSLPRIEGSVTLAGLDSPVEDVRDANAVPHIYAKNQKDAYFALGYVHAQDRLWQMEFMRRLGAGRLAEVLGEPALETDRFIRTLGLYRLAEDIFESTSSEVRTVLEAYAEGVNAWMATRSGILPPEFILLRFEPEPWRPTDSLVWNRLMALRLGRNWNTELLRARIAQKGLNPELLSELWPEDPPSAPVTLAGRSDAMGPMLDASWDSVETVLAADSGSNIWVVHGDRTKTGKPILANDPHLRFGAPVLWYLARIEAPGVTLTGVTVPGVPFIILGHNGSIAWGMTNGGADAQDLFVETLDPSDPKRVLTPKGPQPFITRQEVIRIKGGRTIQMFVRETHHGPVISDVAKEAAGAAGAKHVIALATPALFPDDRTVEAVFAINRARNWHGLYTASADFHTPHTNLVFAAVNGDIGFVSPGRIPVRKAGNGCIPIAGSDGRHDWIDFIPMEMRPQAHNPPSKRIVNANNRIVGDDYPYLMTCDWALPFRAERIVEVLDLQTKHGIIDSQELHRDILSIPARRLMPIMLRAKPVSERGREAMRLLSEWNFEMRRERPEPLLYAAWLRRSHRCAGRG